MNLAAEGAIDAPPRQALLSARSGWSALVIFAVAMVTLVPLFFVIVNSFNAAMPGQPFQWDLAGWNEAFTNPKTLKSVGFSLMFSLRALVAIAVAFTIAWLLVRARIPGASFIEFSLWVAFFLPPLPMTLGWILILDPKYGMANEALRALFGPGAGIFNIFSIPGILWIHLTLTTIPVMTILLAPALRQFDAAIEESARVCGSSVTRVIRSITLPILAPVIFTVLIAALIRSLEAFEIEQLIGTPIGVDVYATRIYDLIRWEPPKFPAAMALSTLFLGILLTLALVYQWYTAGKNYVTLTGRGVSFRPINIGRWRWVASAACLLLVLIGVALPLGTLLMGSFMRLFGFLSINDPFSTKHWLSVLREPSFISAIKNSLIIAFGVAGLGGIVYSLIAYATVRSRLKGRGLIAVMAWMPWAVPGILLGVAILWLLLSVPVLNIIYGSFWALILALAIKEMPIGTHMMKTSFSQVSPELEQASRISGAGWFTTYWRITLPMIAPMLVSIFVLTFIASLRDISTSILLSSASTRPLSLLMIEFSMAGELEAAAVIGVVISIMAIIVALIARRFGLRRPQAAQ
ncbi:MAG: ABC transporter permease [Burkholderiales bacterium]